MANVAVTLLAQTPQDYAVRIDRIKKFARRIHVDIADGELAPTKTIGLPQVYGIDGVQLDLHMMVKHPAGMLENMLALQPDLIILHFEADGDISALLAKIKQLGIKTGLAILPSTSIEAVKPLLPLIDHLLLFTGKFGFNGGVMDTTCLPKIEQAKAYNAQLEIGVDGGVNDETGEAALAAGADVLDVGSFIHDATSPAAAYKLLTKLERRRYDD